VFEVEVVTLADPTGLGAVSLEAPAAALVAIMAGDGGSATPRLALIATGPTGAYPVAMLDPKFFLRAPPSQRWMAVRRTFGAAGAEPVVDQVARIVREALSGSAGRSAALARTPDLELVTRFCRATPSVTLETRLANMHNLCYGVMLKRDAQLAYVPVRYSAYPADGTPVTFGARPAGALPAATLAAVVTALNAFIKETGAPYDPVRQDAPLIDAAGRTAGFCSGSVWWYFDPTGAGSEALVGALVEALGAPVDAPIHFPYDAREVDLAIIAAQRSGAPCQRGELSALAAAAGARNRLYRLFLAEFSAVLRADRDPKMRAALSAAIRATDFASARSAGALRRRLNELLHKFPEDLLTVRDAVAAAVTTVTRDPGAAAIAAIAATTFAFDRRTLAHLRAMPARADVVGALKELMGGRIAARADPAPTPREGSSSESNMYTACGESTTVPQAHCDGRRLIVAPAKLEEFYDILAADVCNSWKESQLAAVAAGVFDPLEFRRRPDEWLRITVGAR
jgi:hypothetical protein